MNWLGPSWMGSSNGLWAARGPNQKGGGQAGGSDGTGKGKTDKDKEGKGGGKGPAQGPNKDRDDGKRAPVGTGNGAHAPRGNQAGKDASGNDTGTSNTATRPDGTTQTYTDAVDDPVAKKNKEVNEDAQDIGEAGWFDSWGSFFDNLGKFAGSSVGVGEREQTFTETANDMATGDATPADGDNTNDASYGFDVATALGSMLGSAVLGLGGGTVVGAAVDMVSDELGRPLDIDLGPNPLGNTSAPDTGDEGGTGGDDGQGGGGDPAGDPGGGGGNVLASKIDGKPKKTTTTDDAIDSGGSGLPTVEPLAGLGIDIVTQTGGGGTSDVGIKSPAQRRRRGSLGGLGTGGGIGI